MSVLLRKHCNNNTTCVPLKPRAGLKDQPAVWLKTRVSVHTEVKHQNHAALLYTDKEKLDQHRNYAELGPNYLGLNVSSAFFLPKVTGISFLYE